MNNFYSRKKVFVTGGAGFIGSVLVDHLLQLGAVVTIGDNLSSGSMENVLRIWKKHGLHWKKLKDRYTTDKDHTFLRVDFQNYDATLNALKGHEIVFHLAANIGGRGYIDTHPADCCDGYSLNANVIKAAHAVGVDRITIASSACVYPEDLQVKYKSTSLLREDMAIKNNWANADKEYGWAKLMGEMVLSAYHRQYGLKGSAVRYVTAYGPWENDTHAIMALIRRAIEKKDPYIIWGTGKQDRDFTYVEDIVSGTLAACEHITDGSAVNIGTSKRYTILESAQIIFKILHWKPKKIVFDRTKPEGVKTRALDIQRAKKLMYWVPKYDLKKGLEETIAWFLKEKPMPVETME